MFRKARIWLLAGLFVGAALLLAACTGIQRRNQAPAAPVGSAAPGDYVEEIISSGQTRHYRLHIPPA